MLKELVEAGAQWVQIDEPILTSELSVEEFRLVEQTYAAINEAVPQLKIILQTYFEKVANYEAVAALPVARIRSRFCPWRFACIAAKIRIPERQST